MGQTKLTLNIATDYTQAELNNYISKKLGIKKFLYKIDKKSLDARNKSNIHWQLSLSVSSQEVKGKSKETISKLNIPYKKQNKKVIVVGSGPAGFFSALVLQKSGFDVTILERGANVTKREQGIKLFEKTSTFDPVSNYAYGEGGAGTFSDGKLTSRSKHISLEKQFIIDSYISAGAPEEIAYLAHPHIGSDNLKKIVKHLRAKFINIGGKIFFETFLKDIKVEKGKVLAVITDKEEILADKVIFATGHSAYETYKMLIDRGVQFHTKNFALGYRVEHEQELINYGQWGKKKLAGVKAAEYRLSTQTEKGDNVYTFCMCPGGKIIPSTAYENTSVVNGMSLYQRNSRFANAGCVATVDINKLLKRQVSAIEAIDWLKELEQKVFDNLQGYQLPACTIQDFLSNKLSSSSSKIVTSYPLGVKQYNLWEILPLEVSEAIALGLNNFSKKIRGFERGNIMGLESKTSSPIQVLRDKQGLCVGFDNVYMVGEGSGYAGGIVSSAADGIRCAMAIIE